MASMDWKEMAGSHMGSDTKAPKVVKSIHIRKNHAGTGHIIEHHHTSPDHPVEEHTTQGDDALAGHVMDHMGTPNPGEAEADAGNAGQPMPAQEADLGNAGAPPVPGTGGQ